MVGLVLVVVVAVSCLFGLPVWVRLFVLWLGVLLFAVDLRCWFACGLVWKHVSGVVDCCSSHFWRLVRGVAL